MRRFFLTFIALQLLFFGVELMQPVQSQVVIPLTAAIARACAAILVWADSSVVSAGKVLMNRSTGFGVSIEPGCNGVEACIVLAAAILAFPAEWRHKAVGLAAGIAAVQAFNLVRIISLFYLGQWSAAWFQFAHEYLWQGLIMLDVLVVFMLWARMYPNRAMRLAST